MVLDKTQANEWFMDMRISCDMRMCVYVYVSSVNLFISYHLSNTIRNNYSQSPYRHILSNPRSTAHLPSSVIPINNPQGLLISILLLFLLVPVIVIHSLARAALPLPAAHHRRLLVVLPSALVVVMGVKRGISVAVMRGGGMLGGVKRGYLTVLCEVDFEDFGVVFEAEGGHCEYNVFAVDCFSFLLVAFF